MDQPSQPNPSGTAVSANEFLTFTLGKEEYGMPILNVQEIRGYDAVTLLANTPDFIKGVSTCAASSCRLWTCASSSISTTPSKTN